MREQNKEKLRALVKKVTSDRQSMEAHARKQQEKRDNFESQIAKLENEIIIPLAKEFGEEIKTEYQYTVGKETAGVRFRIMPITESEFHDMLFRPDSQQRKLLIEISPRVLGSKQYAAEIPVDDVESRVEDQIMKFISAVIGKKAPV